MSQPASPKAAALGPIRRLFSYTLPYRKWFALGLFLTVFLAVLDPIRPFLFQHTLDNAVAKGDLSSLNRFSLLIMSMLLFQSMVMYANTYLLNWLGQTVIRDIRKQVFDHILHLRLRYFDTTPIGQLQTRTISDVEVLNDIFSSGIVRILGDILQLITILIFMLYTNWQLALVVLTTVPLLIWATRTFQKKVKAAFTLERTAVGEMNGFLQEHISGMNVVQVFNREDEEMRRYIGINEKLRHANIKSVLYYSIFFPVIDILSAIAIALVVWYGAYHSIQGAVSFGTIVAFIMYISMFFRPLRMLAEEFNTLQRGMVSAGRIFDVLDTKEFIPNTGTLHPTVSEEQGIEIEFKDVWFAYIEPENGQQPDWVLKGVSFRIEPGQRAAFVGATGSGKSTIINLLSRFYEIQKGEILVNGINIQEYDIHALRALIGVVLQDVFLFTGTVRDNIALNDPHITDAQVRQAAGRVGAHEFITRLPGDYAYDVQERGATLSLGQRQLLAFARVMVYDPRILVLDEATANIDTESEELIQRAVDTVMEGRTCVIIAHRLSTIQKADLIVVLSKGEIMEQGSHADLLAQGGAYAALHEAQAVG